MPADKMALSTLPPLLTEHGWDAETAEPDFFGVTRITAARGDWTLRLVFSEIGYMDGGYLYGPTGDTWHTERRTDVRRWIENAGIHDLVVVVCRNTVNPDSPLPGRATHLARLLPPGRTKPAEEKQ